MNVKEKNSKKNVNVVSVLNAEFYKAKRGTHKIRQTIELTLF